MKRLLAPLAALLLALVLSCCGSTDGEAGTVRFHDKTFDKSELSSETIDWLERYNGLTDEEQSAVSYIPSDLYKLCGCGEAGDIEAADAER